MSVRTPLENYLRTQISSCTGFDFQDFVVELMYRKYGTKGFESLRPVKDGGGDGIIHAEGCAIACYGTKDATLAKFAKKIEADFQLYAAMLQDRNPKWRFFVNFDYGVDHIDIASSLHGDKDVLCGLTRLCEHIKELDLGKRITMYRFLKIPVEVFAVDFVKTFLGELLNFAGRNPSIHHSNVAPELEKKIRFNFEQSDIDPMLALAKISLAQQVDVDEVINSMGGDDVELLKGRIVGDFALVAGGNFSEKFKLLVSQYAARYNIGDDDALLAYIRALLIHMFSLCVIGVEPPKAI